MNYEDAVAENNTMVNVGMGVDVISASKNVHQTQGYEGGPDTQKDRDIRIAGNYISLAKPPASAEWHGSAAVFI